MGGQADDQLPGLTVAEPRAGRVERAVRDSLAAAQLDARDAGAGELAASCARAVDLAHMRKDPYAVASTARELREQLVRLRMDPAARLGGDAGEVAGWLAGLNQPEPAQDDGS